MIQSVIGFWVILKWSADVRCQEESRTPSLQGREEDNTMPRTSLKINAMLALVRIFNGSFQIWHDPSGSDLFMRSQKHGDSWPHTRSILHCKHNHDALSCLSRPRSFAARICSELSCWEWQLRLRTVSAYPESPIRYVGASQSHPSLLNTIIDSTLLFVDPTRTVATRTFVWQRVRATTWKPTVAKLLSRALVFKSKCRQCDCVAPVSTKSVSLTNGRTLEFFV